MEVVPLSQFFVYTQSHLEGEFSAVKWLSKIDMSVVQRIIEASDMFFELEDEDQEEAPFECMDYLTLAYMIGEMETNRLSESFTDKEKENCLIGLATFAQCEKLRREELLNFTGSGKISEIDSHTTNIELTEKGNVIGSSMSTLYQISEAVAKN